MIGSLTFPQCVEYPWLVYVQISMIIVLYFLHVHFKWALYRSNMHSFLSVFHDKWFTDEEVYYLIREHSFLELYVLSKDDVGYVLRDLHAQGYLAIQFATKKHPLSRFRYLPPRK